jgi:glycosyltransferase involved in cell wall biosynthesis
MPRLLLVFEFPTVSGGENSQLVTLPRVRTAGYDVLALAPDPSPLALALRREDVPVIPWRVGDAQGRRQAQSDLRHQLQSHLRKLRPDLVHAISLSMTRLVAPVAAWSSIACVGHLRDIVRLSRQAINDLNCSTRLLAVSHATRHWHVQAGLCADKTMVLYNGVDLDRFRPGKPTGAIHREFGIEPSCPLVGGIGQLIMRKGVDVWLQCAGQVAASRADVRFLIAGERYSQKHEALQFEQGLRERAGRAPLKGRVHFLGQRDDIDRLLNELCVLVHAARQEPLGRVLLEAGAAGTAVVATKVGGTSEIFPPESNSARLVTPDDAAALARATIDLLADDHVRQSQSRAARKRVEQQFDAVGAARQLVAHYQAAHGTPPGRT